jgi:hypothetical protein
MVDFNYFLYFFIIFLLQFHMNLIMHNERDGLKSRTISLYMEPLITHNLSVIVLEKHMHL